MPKKETPTHYQKIGTSFLGKSLSSHFMLLNNKSLKLIPYKISSEKVSHLMWSSQWPWEVEMRPEAQKGWGWDPDPLTSWPCWHSTWVCKEKSSSGAWKCRTERYWHVFRSVCVLLMPRWCSRDQVCPLSWHNQKSRWDCMLQWLQILGTGSTGRWPPEGGWMGWVPWVTWLLAWRAFPGCKAGRANEAGGTTPRGPN